MESGNGKTLAFVTPILSTDSFWNCAWSGAI